MDLSWIKSKIGAFWAGKKSSICLIINRPIADEIAQGIARGDLDPITLEPFPVITNEELKMIERVAKRKNNPAQSYKSLILGQPKSE